MDGLEGAQQQARRLLPTVTRGSAPSSSHPVSIHAIEQMLPALAGNKELKCLSVKQPSSPVPVHCSSLYPFNSFAGRLGRTAVSIDTRPKVIGKVLEDSIQTTNYLLLLQSGFCLSALVTK